MNIISDHPNMTGIYALILIVLIAFFASCNKAPRKMTPTWSLELEKDWQLQSSAKTGAVGQEISSLDFKPLGWYTTSVPSTVLAALVNNKVYENIYYGKNLEKVPTEQFNGSWWYRREFSLDESFTGLTNAAQLIFEGINYRADIWLNGKKVAAAQQIIGAFRIFELAIGKHLKKEKNVLAVEVFPPQPGDFTIGFVDWNPAPPDQNMGLWRGVKLKFSGAVSIANPFVQTRVKLDTLAGASLTISSLLRNHSDQPVAGVLEGRIEEKTFRHPFRLKAKEKKTITFDPDQFEILNIKNPRLWWPNNLGKAELYQLFLTASIENKKSHQTRTTFGIREVSDYINEEGHRGYKVNGKKVLIRGGGWVDDLLLADSYEKLEAQFKYVKHMNLNTVRLEGFWGSNHDLYDLADQYGILLMAGWSCHWEWKEYVGKPVDDFGGITTPEEIELIARSLQDQVVWLRNHPSIFVWVVGSDKLPRPALEEKYNQYMPRVDSTRPILMSCKLLKSDISGSTAVKMAGPYDYVPPVYWYEDTQNGGAFGFNTETGPGPQPLPFESLQRMMPKEHLWPVNDMWDYHCGRNEFNTIKRYLAAFNKRYGAAQSAAEFSFKAQAANYEAMRAMFESFGINKPNATGVIQWMLNSAWPEMYWQLYDYYLMPNGAFYGTKTASQPVNIAYHYGEKAIYIINDTLEDKKELEAEIRILDIHSKTIWSGKEYAKILANRSVKLLKLPGIKNLTAVYFLDLKLKDKAGTLLADKFYWLSKKADLLDQSKTTWFVTPQKQFADLTALNQLQKVKIDVQHRFGRASANNEQTVEVTLKNPTDKIAFFIELKVVDEKTGNSILPVFWDDNYISLLPGESKTISGSYPYVSGQASRPVFRFTGWNLAGS